MKDFELRYVGSHVEVYTGSGVFLFFRPIRCGKQWKNWQSKRPQTGRDFSENVKLM